LPYGVFVFYGSAYNSGIGAYAQVLGGVFMKVVVCAPKGLTAFALRRFFKIKKIKEK